MASKNERIRRYLGLSYEEMVKDQIDWAKIYFKEYSKDLESKANSMRMAIDLNAYIGDTISFYIEDRAKNSNLVTSKDISSIIDNGNSLGFKFQGPISARGIEAFYIEVPATTGSGGNYIPDLRYAPVIKSVQLQNTNGVVFEALSDVDFKSINLSSSLNVKVSKRDSAGVPLYFVLKTEAEVIAGKTVTETISIGDYEANRTIKLSNKNVLDILSIKDSSGDDWEEVDYLVQDVVFEAKKNVSSDSVDVPYVLKIKSAPKRFVKKVDPKNGVTSLTFGNGKSEDIGNQTVPDPSLVSFDLKGKMTFSNPFIDPQDFLKTRNLGLAPTNTQLTVKARIGGGKITNTAQNSLNSIISKNVDLNTDSLEVSQVNRMLNSFSARNLKSIEGGDDAPEIEEVKSLISANFATQGRVNVKEDYIVRILSMPSIFGKVFRVHPVGNCNPQAGVQIYVLSKNSAGQITTPSDTMKKNIKSYLSLSTRINQGIDLLDGKVINIGIEYSIVVEPGLNKTQVKLETLLKVKDYFKINLWQLNQPIFIDRIKCLIEETPGVISIPEFSIVNNSNIKNGLAYSSEVYDIKGNTRKNIIFCKPSSIFELKYPNTDIKVSAI